MSKNDFQRLPQIPIVETDMFDRLHENFAVGIAAVGDKITDGCKDIFDGMAQLRAAVYLDKGYVAANQLDANGTELDGNDRRAVHFVTLERTSVDGLARVVANMRLIVKDSDKPLPVEELFPDDFGTQPATLGSTEVSRLISQHEDIMTRNILKWPLFRAGLEYIQINDLGPAYGVVTAALARSLQMQQVPIDVLDEPQYLPEINATKQPIRINLNALDTVIKKLHFQGVPLSSGIFSYGTFNEQVTRNNKGEE